MQDQPFCGQCGRQLLADDQLKPESPVPVAALPPVKTSSRASQRLRSLKGRTEKISPEALVQHPEPVLALKNTTEDAPVPEELPVPPAAPPVYEDSAWETETPPPMQDIDPLQRLTEYGLISIELMNLADLAGTTDDQAEVDRFTRDCRAYIDDRVLAANGVLESSKGAILFIGFPNEPDLTASLRKAVDWSLSLLEEDFRLQDVRLKIRIGLDIERKSGGPSIASVTERTVAPPGALIISMSAHEYLREFYDMQMIGPLPLGSRMVPFYQLQSSYQPLPMPSAEALLGDPAPSAPPVSPEPMPTLPEARHEPIQASSTAPSAAQPPTPPSPSQQVAAANVSAQNVVRTPEVILPPAPEPSTPSKASPIPVLTSGDEFPRETPAVGAEIPAASSQTVQEEPESVSEPEPDPENEQTSAETSSAVPENGLAALNLFDGTPQPIRYEAPVWLLRKATRTPNVTYEKALEGLYSELYGFCGTPGRTGCVVSLSSTEGLGRSNIVGMVRGRLDPGNELAVWLGSNNYRMYADQPVPLLLWLEILHNLLGLVPEGQPEGEVQELIERFLRHVFNDTIPEDMRTFLMTFLSVERLQPLEVEDRERQGWIENRLFELLSSITEKKSLVLIIEDLDYADPASLEVLARLLAKGLLNKPVCLVLTHQRNLYATGELERLLQNHAYKELVVSDLSQAEVEIFLNDGPFGGNLSTVPFPLLDELIAKAHGLPLYLEETTRLLHLQGVLAVNGETGKFTYSDPPVGGLPDSVRHVITLRMEFLSTESRYLLQLASVLGEKFPVSLLMSLAQMEEAAFNDTLTLLFEHGYLVPDVVNTGRFRHGLLWRAVYESMQPDLRQRLHQLTSQALENDFNTMTVHPGLVAYHAERGNLPNRAFNFWNLTGIHAAQSGSLTGMNLAMFHALALIAESAEGQSVALRIEENLGSFNVAAQPDLGEALLRNVILRAQQSGDSARLLEAMGMMASCYERRGDYLKALEILDASLQRVPEETHPLEFASIQMTRMEYFYTLGRLQKARELMEQEIEPRATRYAPDPDYFDSLLQARLLYAQTLLDQFDARAFTMIEELLSYARERNLEGLNIALQLARAQGFLKKGLYESCDREADGLLQQIEALEDSDWFLAQWGLLAMSYHCEMGDWESARQLVLTVITRSEQAHDYLTLALAQTYAGRIAYGLGNYKEAKKLLEQAISKSSDYRFAAGALLGWRCLAETELALGAREVAYEIASKALGIAQKPEIRNQYEAALLVNVCARCLLQLGDIKRAGKLLESQWPKVVDSKYGPLIAETAYWIGELYRHMAQDAPSELSRKHLERSVQFFSRSKSLWLEMKNRYRHQHVQEAIPHV